MDKAKMIAEIAARHNIKLGRDDPAFLLVELNMMALDNGIEGLTKWKTDVTALVGALEKGSKAWQETADSIGKAIFKDQMSQFVKDTDLQKEEFLRSVRLELNQVLGEAVGPAVHRLNQAAVQVRREGSFIGPVIWAVVGALIGSVIACVITLSVAKSSFETDVTKLIAPARNTTNRR